MKTIEGRELIEWAQENDFNGTHVLDIKLITALRAELQSVTAHDKSSVSNWEFALKERDELRAELSALRARPQEPGLSQEWLDELIRGHSLALQNWSTFQSAWANYWRGIEWLRDAILSAPSGPLSDPERDFINLFTPEYREAYSEGWVDGQAVLTGFRGAGPYESPNRESFEGDEPRENENQDGAAPVLGGEK